MRLAFFTLTSKLAGKLDKRESEMEMLAYCFPWLAGRSYVKETTN